MKKKILLIVSALSLAFFLQDCKKLKKYTDFDTTYSNSFTIPASGGIVSLPIDIITPETTTNTEGTYDGNGTSAKLVDEVTLKDLNLVITAPQQASFDFLSYIEIYLSSASEPEILLASKYDIPETGLRTLVLDPHGDNLKAYLQESTFKIRVKTMTRRAFSYDISVTANETFHVKAKLKNLFRN